MSEPLPPEPNLAHKLTEGLSADEMRQATDAWVKYIQLKKLALQPDPEQAESEGRLLDLAADRIVGLWQMILASRGYKVHEWEFRLADALEGFDLMGGATK